MHTRSANGHASLGTAAKDVTDHAKTLVKLERELATLELKRKVAALGLGIGLLVIGAVFGVFGLGFALATVAAALATFLATWLSLLIVALGLLLLMGVLVVVGLSAIKKATPPLPEQAIEEAKRTTEALRSDVHAH
jgi:tetrahydromethanopterin S-methyltransferase subunit C